MILNRPELGATTWVYHFVPKIYYDSGSFLLTLFTHLPQILNSGLIIII